MQSFDSDSKILEYEVKFDNKQMLKTTRAFLRPSSEPDNVARPSTVEDYKVLGQEVAKDDLEHFLHLKGLTYLEEDYLKAQMNDLFC